MTDTLAEMTALRARDPRAFAAYGAAVVVASIDETMTGRPAPGRDALFWPRLGAGDVVDEQPTAEMAIAIEILAPLVRQVPDAPGETLYRHAAGAGVHSGPADGYGLLSLGQRSAFQAFSVVLTCLDELQARNDALTASQNPQIPRGEFLPVEDTILDMGHDATTLDKTLSEERVVTIIPGTGLAPGHVQLARPAPPSIESNRVVKAPFMPTLTGPDGSDRTGHGFDADARFVPDAGPIQGPAGAMSGREDPQRARHEPVLSGDLPADETAGDDDEDDASEAEPMAKKRRRTRTKAERLADE